MSTGVLYLVATPLGNLGDISYRAVKILKSVDLIACEDTRTSRTLLRHYDINKPLVSYHNFNERQISEKIISRIQNGESVAVISDAGTPSISDPGFVVVRAAVDAGIRIEAIPGPAAVVTALAVSGLPTDAFIFYGFLPPKAGKRSQIIESLADRRETLIFYESPFKINKLVTMLHEILGDRRVALCRELTKKFEDVIRTDLADLDIFLRDRKLKGEITLVVEGLTRQLRKES